MVVQNGIQKKGMNKETKNREEGENLEWFFRGLRRDRTKAKATKIRQVVTFRKEGGYIHAFLSFMNWYFVSPSARFDTKRLLHSWE